MIFHGILTECFFSELNFDLVFIPFNFQENKIYRISLYQKNIPKASELLVEAAENILVGELFCSLHEIALFRAGSMFTKQLLNHNHKIISGFCQIDAKEVADLHKTVHLQFRFVNCALSFFNK